MAVLVISYPQESVIAISSSDEEEGEEEEVDYMRTVSEMAEDVNITNLFDPRVLGRLGGTILYSL